MSATSTSRGGSPRNGPLAQLGRAVGDPERAVDPLFVGSVGQRFEGGHVLGRPGGPHQLRAEALRWRDDDLDRDSLDGDADRAPLLAIDHGNDQRQALEALQDLRGILRGADDREVEGRVPPATRISGRLSAERLGDGLDERTRAVEQHPAARARRPFLPEPGDDLRLGLRPDAGHAGEPAGRHRLPKALDRPHVERSPDLRHPLRPQPEQPSQPDELRSDLLLELLQLVQRAGLDELLQPQLDPRPDSPQLARPARAHEVRHRRLRLANHLRGAPVGPRRVVTRLRQVEQRRERLQLVGDLRVRNGHAGIVSPHGDDRHPVQAEWQAETRSSRRRTGPGDARGRARSV